MSAPSGWDMLTAEQCLIVNAILDGPAAWSHPGALAAAVGLSYEQTADVIAGMGDWLDPWVRDDGVHFTLSPLAAERLGFRVDGDDSGAVYWTRDAATARPVTHAARLRTEANAELVEAAPDPSPDHRDMIEALDYFNALIDRAWPATARKRKELWERLPNPTVCLGMSDPCYLPVHDFTRKNPRMGSCGVVYPENPQNGRTCKGCKGLPVAEYECCPRCSRDGLEGVRNRLIRLEAARAAG